MADPTVGPHPGGEGAVPRGAQDHRAAQEDQAEEEAPWDQADRVGGHRTAQADQVGAHRRDQAEEEAPWDRADRAAQGGRAAAQVQAPWVDAAPEKAV